MNWIILTLYLYTAIIIIMLLYIVRERLSRIIYGGVRVKNYVIIDTGETGYTVLSKTLNSCEIGGVTRTVNRGNAKAGTLYFIDDCVENLKIEPSGDKWEYYCNTDEFDTVHKNTLLRQFLYIAEKNYLLITMIVVVMILLLDAYNTMQVYETKSMINYAIQEAINNGAIPDVTAK